MKNSSINSSIKATEVGEKTEVIEGIDNVISKAIERWRNTKEKIDSYVDKLQPESLVTTKIAFEEIKNLARRGVRTRTIFEITEDNIFFVKELINVLGPDAFRHLDNVAGNFSISDGQIVQTVIIGDLSIPNSIISNVKSFVKQQQYLFELLWEKAVPAEERIREIEEGIKPEVVEIIKNPYDIQNVYLNLIESAKEEILLVLPIFRASKVQTVIGIVKSIEESAKRNKKTDIRILLPKYKEVEKQIQSLKQYTNIRINYIEPSFETQVAILVADRKISLIIEILDDVEKAFPKVKNHAIYDTHKPKVMSFVSIFETLWRQTELLEQIERHDKIQKEFIDTAAHELRSPIQPILGLSELLTKENITEEQREFVDIIYRNAKRLKKLTEDILDITRIEGNTFEIHKDRFNLNDVVLDIVKDFEKNAADSSKKVRFEYVDNTDFIVYADRNKIGRVFANLIDNSVKFIHDEGTISISLEKAVDDKGNEMIIVSIKDTGKGIDEEILPRLFTKFTSKSFNGIGLGLYISKSIVESHDGQIWAENNQIKGATFRFSIPLGP